MPKSLTEGYWIDPADGNNVVQCSPAEACYVWDTVEGVLSGNCTLGRAVQGASIKTRVESAPGVCNQRLEPECDEPLSNVAFNFNLRQYIGGLTSLTLLRLWGGGLHSFAIAFHLNLCCFCD